jgi:hypothetical protein
MSLRQATQAGVRWQLTFDLTRPIAPLLALFRVSSCPRRLRPGRTQGSPSLSGAISGRSRFVRFLTPRDSWLPTVEHVDIRVIF